MANRKDRVCPVELSNSLDSKIRRWLQNPRKILAPFIRTGMTALDLGCGPGFFSIELAGHVGAAGKVIAVDLQQGMLNRLHDKVKGTEFEGRITLVQCEKDNINVSETVDFILAFYMVHEIPDKDALFRQLNKILSDQGQCLLVEPKLFHVSEKDFQATLRLAQNNGFEIFPGPKLLASWSAILEKKHDKS
jgi:ubiquinone/menaquinone biosynthesis C-methylase UbiE